LATGLHAGTISPQGFPSPGIALKSHLMTKVRSSGGRVMSDREGSFSDVSAATPHYHGHRERLRQRFFDHGHEALQDYELLELILFAPIRRADTKPVAKDLIARFGSFADVLAAPPARLKEVRGVGDRAVEAIKLAHAVAQRFSRAQIRERRVLSSWSAVLDYVRTAMAFAEKEEFRVLFLDKKNALIADEVQQRGTVDHTPVYPREVVKRALELSATALILVHNHPTTPLSITLDHAQAH